MIESGHYKQKFMAFYFLSKIAEMDLISGQAKSDCLEYLVKFVKTTLSEESNLNVIEYALKYAPSIGSYLEIKEGEII